MSSQFTFKCDVCGKVVDAVADERHIDRRHSDRKPPQWQRVAITRLTMAQEVADLAHETQEVDACSYECARKHIVSVVLLLKDDQVIVDVMVQPMLLTYKEP
jgi:hypothetical protein